MRLRSAVEERKNDASIAKSTGRRAETAISSSARADNRRHRDNVSKNQIELSDKPLGATGRSVKNTAKRVADSRSNGRTYAANGKNNVGSRVASADTNSKVDRADQTARSTPEGVLKNEETSIPGVPPAASPRTEAEKKRKISRLPVRTWKRVRTRGPVALRHESETTSKTTAGGKPQDADVETAQLDNPRYAEADEDREKMARDRMSRRRDDLMPKDRYGDPLGADKPGSTPADQKGLKGIKSFNTTKGTRERRKTPSDGGPGVAVGSRTRNRA